MKYLILIIVLAGCAKKPVRQKELCHMQTDGVVVCPPGVDSGNSLMK